VCFIQTKQLQEDVTKLGITVGKWTWSYQDLWGTYIPPLRITYSAIRCTEVRQRTDMSP
jgi:hypothetical protein